MKIKFWKMSAAGNDFIFIKDFKIKGKNKLAIKLCNRRLSIGADGLVFIKKLNDSSIKLEYFNSDGSKAFCGNASRSAAMWFYREIKNNKIINLHTIKGILKAEIIDNKNVKIQMPVINSIKLYCKDNFPSWVKEIHFIDSGVPHAIIPVKDIEKMDIISKGQEIRYHKFFSPNGTNVDFISKIKNMIYIRTYERGVENETLSCGTGITAVGIISGIIYNKKSPITIISRSKEKFKVWFKKKLDKIYDIYIQGPAEIIFKGEIEI